MNLPNPHTGLSQDFLRRSTRGNNDLLALSTINPDREVTGLLTDDLLLDLHSEMRESWLLLDKPKAIAIPYRATYSDEHKFRTAKKITAAIGHALGGISPSVFAPEPSSHTLSTSKTYKPPWCYLVTDIPQDDIDHLVSTTFISNQHISVQIFSFSPPHSGYVSSIRGLKWTKSSDQGKVEALIRESLESNAKTKSFIDDFITERHDRIPPDAVRHGTAFDWTMSTVRAYLHTLGNDPENLETLWRWYVTSPTEDTHQTTIWSSLLEELPFHSIDAGWGKPFHIECCTGCKSTNHPTHGCPFPKRYPQLEETNPVPQATARGHGRGGRDRGRGNRGNRGRGNNFRNTTSA